MAFCTVLSASVQGLGVEMIRVEADVSNGLPLEKKGNEILLTSKGKQLLEISPGDLKKPELTASWEMELAKIASFL